MAQDVWTPMITSDHSLRNKVAHAELLRGLVPRYAVTVIYRNQQRKKKKIFCPPKKKQSQKQKNNDFRKVVISDKMQGKKEEFLSSEKKKNFSPPKKRTDDFRNVVIPYLWCKRPRNKPCDACLWKPGQRNAVRASKQLQFVASTETFNGNQALAGYSPL